MKMLNIDQKWSKSMKTLKGIKSAFSWTFGGAGIIHSRHLWTSQHTRHTLCCRIVGQMKYVALCDCHCMWMWMWPLLLPNNSNTNQLSSSHHHGYLPRSPYKHLPTSLALSTPHTNNMPIFQPSSKFIYQDPLFFLDLTPSQHESRVPTAPSSSPTLITTTIPNSFITSLRHLLADRNMSSQ